MISTTVAHMIDESIRKVNIAAASMLTDTADTPNADRAAKALASLWSGVLESAEVLSNRATRGAAVEVIAQYGGAGSTRRDLETLVAETDRLVRRVQAVYISDFQAPA